MGLDRTPRSEPGRCCHDRVPALAGTFIGFGGGVGLIVSFNGSGAGASRLESVSSSKHLAGVFTLDSCVFSPSVLVVELGRDDDIDELAGSILAGSFGFDTGDSSLEGVLLSTCLAGLSPAYPFSLAEAATGARRGEPKCDAAESGLADNLGEAYLELGVPGRDCFSGDNDLARSTSIR